MPVSSHKDHASLVAGKSRREKYTVLRVAGRPFSVTILVLHPLVARGVKGGRGGVWGVAGRG